MVGIKLYHFYVLFTLQLPHTNNVSTEEENLLSLPALEIIVNMSNSTVKEQQFREGNWLLQDHQRRKQALTGLNSAFKQKVREQKESTFSSASFCKLMAQEVTIIKYTFVEIYIHKL